MIIRIVDTRMSLNQRKRSAKYGTFVDHKGYEWPIPTPNYPLMYEYENHKALRSYILHRDNYECKYCGRKTDLEIDHIIPRFHNGTHNPSNLQVLCMYCNNKKGTKI